MKSQKEISSLTGFTFLSYNMPSFQESKRQNVDYIHGYGAFGYDSVFEELGFVRNRQEVHYLQMLNWESRKFSGEEKGLSWIQY